jgi:hypothetical protein
MAVGTRKRVVVVGLGMVGISFMYVGQGPVDPSLAL